MCIPCVRRRLQTAVGVRVRARATEWYSVAHARTAIVIVVGRSSETEDVGGPPGTADRAAARLFARRKPVEVHWRGRRNERREKQINKPPAPYPTPGHGVNITVLWRERRGHTPFTFFFYLFRCPPHHYGFATTIIAYRLRPLIYFSIKN